MLVKRHDELARLQAQRGAVDVDALSTAIENGRRRQAELRLEAERDRARSGEIAAQVAALSGGKLPVEKFETGELLRHARSQAASRGYDRFPIVDGKLALEAVAIQVQAQAEQFAFYFRYPGADGKFGNIHPDKIDEGNQNYFGLDPANEVEARDDIVSGELVIPVNREIQLLMHAKDVGHSFYVRELRIQQDFVPGLDLSVHFTATKVGKYEIVCTQLCGLGHYNMKAYLNVMSEADYEKWLKDQAAAQ